MNTLVTFVKVFVKLFGGLCGDLWCGEPWWMWRAAVRRTLLAAANKGVFVTVFSGRVFGKVVAELLTEISNRLI